MVTMASYWPLFDLKLQTADDHLIPQGLDQLIPHRSGCDSRPAALACQGLPMVALRELGWESAPREARGGRQQLDGHGRRGCAAKAPGASGAAPCACRARQPLTDGRPKL